MADSFLGDIAGQLGGVVTPEISAALSGLTPQISEALGSLAESVGHATDGLHIDVSAIAGDAVTPAVEATAEPAPFTLPAGVDAEEFQKSLESLHDKLQSLENEGLAKTASADAAEQAHGQLIVQQSQALMEQVESVLQHVGDNAVDAMHDLHADGTHDATIVAVADQGDGHVMGHADSDAGYSHGTEHVAAAAAHEDTTTSDPSAAA